MGALDVDSVGMLPHHNDWKIGDDSCTYSNAIHLLNSDFTRDFILK